MITLFYNRLPHNLCLSIEEDAQNGTFSFVSDRNDSSDGIICIQYTNSTVEASDEIRSLLSGRIVGRKVTFVARGSVKFNDEIHQTGSAWDAEEAVYGVSHDWTKTGVLCITVSFDENGRLTSINYNSQYPFVNPQGSDEGPSYPGIPYEINPWRYIIHRVGEIVLIGKSANEKWSTVAHKVSESDSEQLYFTPEVDIPVYKTVCGETAGNEAPGSDCHSFFPINTDWLQSNVTFCPICFRFSK